mmetsp:Transcript_44507/g.144538  ORF Transcript_44507/g.144538 Transcript_44507/m.144538 type:complete len:328 (+) Transcript_44507:396-1379(+)
MRTAVRRQHARRHRQDLRRARPRPRARERRGARHRGRDDQGVVGGLRRELCRRPRRVRRRLSGRARVQARAVRRDAGADRRRWHDVARVRVLHPSGRAARHRLSHRPNHPLLHPVGLVLRQHLHADGAGPVGPRRLHHGDRAVRVRRRGKVQGSLWACGGARRGGQLQSARSLRGLQGAQQVRQPGGIARLHFLHRYVRVQHPGPRRRRHLLADGVDDGGRTRHDDRRTVRVAVGHDRLHRPHHVQKVRRDAGLLGTLRHLLPRLWAVGTVRHPRLAHPARHLRGHPRLHRHAHRWPVRRSDSQALVPSNHDGARHLLVGHDSSLGS